MTFECVRMSILCVLHVKSILYTSCSFFGLICTPHTFQVSKSDQYLYFDVYIIHYDICSSVNSGQYMVLVTLHVYFKFRIPETA